MALPDSNNEVTARKLGATISAMWTKIKSTFAPISHTHGNITNAGALQTTDVSVANGDKLVVTDASNSNKVARTSVTFDGSTTTTALTPKGTFESFYQKPSGGIPDSDIASASTWSGKQDALTAQTAYTSQGSATKVPQITTNSLGQVTGITEVTISGVTPASHTHGNITNAGGITATGVTIANGDSLAIVDSSETNKLIAKSSVTFDGSTTTKALTQKGTFETFYQKPTGGIPDTDIASASTWSGKQDALTAQTAYSAKGSATKVPQITTNSLGQVTGITEVTISGVTPASHTHGNITNAGGITASGVTIANGDSLAIVDASDTNKVIAKSSITFDGSTTTKALTQKGTFETFYQKPSGGIPDTDITSASTWNAKQDALTAQTAYTTKGSATKVPQITTNSLGQVTGITEVTISHQDISGKEDTTNKVTSWSSTTNDTHYPSEKLVKDSLDLKAPLASPTFTGTPKAPTATAGTNTTQIATTAFVKSAVDTAIADVADALVYKGTIAGGSTGSYGALTAAANKGYLYKVSAAGKIDGVQVEVGDMIICNADNTAAATSSNYTTIAASWDFIQTNIEGYVLGPSSSVDAHVATFDGTTGNTIKDSGYTIATSIPSGAVFTDTKVTSSGNHYTPSTASGSDQSASATGATAEWGIDVVKGVTLNTDGKGHVTGISVTSGKIPSNPNTDTKVKATAKTDNVNYKILATASASPTSGNATEAVYDADITLNPSTNTIAANISGDAATASAAKSGSTLETAINGKQDALTAQTAYSAKGSATKVPQITTNSLGQVTGITEVTITGVTPASHTHGNITNAGGITATGVTIANGDSLAIVDSSETNKVIAKSSITFDGSTTTKALTQKGTFETFYQKPSTGIPDSDIASASTWNGKQDALTAQTAYSAKGSATKVPQITTNSLGQVTGITEVTITGVTPASHKHGNITNAGGITATGVDIANGDSLVIVDSSETNKLIKQTSITFDGSTTTKALTQKGTFETFQTAITYMTTAQETAIVTELGDL